MVKKYMQYRTVQPLIMGNFVCSKEKLICIFHCLSLLNTDTMQLIEATNTFFCRERLITTQWKSAFVVIM